jgi:hypothetical protein
MSQCPKRYRVSNPAIGEFGVPTCLSFNSTILPFFCFEFLSFDIVGAQASLRAGFRVSDFEFEFFNL